ncbi:DNA polymerase III, beta subunit [Orientia chuto str. Dubai]|uniref:Beta sliding clamp n=1 Tax=Orientia chuto str. Dubai TaxID=1359168 RepID=A0A0F3MPY1_9RICK|nr:DNA polymerase III subunit beta [Candidatus Orientia mediorientalis]KJV56649.1 DNA polymerase III, beta subunit [Orientia chuto str. Dubai]
MAANHITNNGDRGIFDIKLDTKTFWRALDFCMPILERKNVDQILGNVKLTHTFGTPENYLEISATDGDIFIYQKLPIKISQKDINITLPLRALSEIISKIPHSEFTICCQKDNKLVQIKGGKYLEFNLAALPSNLFPVVEEISDSDFVIHTTAIQLAQIIEYAKFAMSTEEMRYNLNGIYLHSKDYKSLIAAATDGHRLASIKCCINTFKKYISSNDGFGVILSYKTVTELHKILKELSINQYNVIIRAKSNRIQFDCKNITIISKLIDGNFPEYEPFIPVNNTKEITINSEYLSKSIDRVSTIAMEKSKIVILDLDQDAITVRAYGNAQCQAQELLLRQQYNYENQDRSSQQKIEVYEYIGDNQLTIAFNAKYLLDVLKVCDNTKVPIKFKDSISPALLQFERDNISATFVIMPVSVPNQESICSQKKEQKI